MSRFADFLSRQRLKRMEKKLKEYKPKLLASWYEKQEDEIRQEYQEEFEKRDDQIYYLQKEVSNEHKNAEYWHGKYDAMKDAYDSIKTNVIQKVESTAMKAGEQKEQIKNLKNDLKERE